MIFMLDSQLQEGYIFITTAKQKTSVKRRGVKVLRDVS